MLIQNRFIDTGDIYIIDSEEYSVVYDRITNIVYLFNDNGALNASRTSISPLYGIDKQVMTLDEYNKTK